MTSIDITFNPERSKKLFKNYFAYERKREFKKVPIVLLYSVCFLLIGIDWFADLHLLWKIGFGALILITSYILFYLLKFQLALNRINKEIELAAKSSPIQFQFSFDSEGVTYASEHEYSQMKWELIKTFAVNGEDIYLFTENHKLLEIISPSIIGQEHFDHFKELLSSKVKPVN
jgi:hypothetical protein